MKTLRFHLEGREAILYDVAYTDKLKDALSYYPPGYRFSPAFKQFLRTKNTEYPSGWDGRKSFLKNRTIPIGLLIGAYKELKEKGFKVKLLGWKNRPKVKQKEGFSEKNKKYQFQNHCVSSMLDCLNRGGGTVLSATGSGKTKTTAQFFSAVGVPCVFVVDQLILLYQAQKELSKWLGEKVGIVGNSKFKPQRITVATIQTLSANKKKVHFKKWINGIKVVVIDELHKQMGKRNFDIINVIKPEAVIGLTATLQMKKKEVRWKVYSICGPVVFEYSAKQGVEDGVLSRGSVVQLQFPDTDHRAVLPELKELFPAMMTAAQRKRAMQEREYQNQVAHHPDILKFLGKLSVAAGPGLVILCNRVKHTRKIGKLIPQLGPKIVRGSVDKKKRQQIMRDFDKERLDVIIASSVFTKGVNLKRICTIIDVAQGSSRNDAQQKLGRGLRLHSTKKYLRYIDIATVPSFEKQASQRRNAIEESWVQGNGFEMAVHNQGSVQGTQGADEMSLEFGPAKLYVIRKQTKAKVIRFCTIQRTVR